jgi:enoyl-CoA hydratase/carnithine racemase
MPQSSIRLLIRDDRFATLTFDAPDRTTNVLTEQTWRDLEVALRVLIVQTDVRGVILKSAKPDSFIVGADLKLLAVAEKHDPRVKAVIEYGHRVLNMLESLPCPTCALVDGVALGGGLEVALACDVILMGTSAKVKMGLPEVKFGLMPGWGGTQRLPRLIGLPFAAELIGTGKSITAVRAAEIDLALGPIDSGSLLQSAMQIMGIEGWQSARRQKMEWISADARALYRPQLDGASHAVREALTAMVDGAALPLPEAIVRESQGFFALAGSDESKSLINQFYASRK